ncbi:MAG: DUF2851 family protein [Flavobacteriaceae bacterium]|jgi:hypothetical protein|nr:DUF2851 family protein [Flavobacteriaceae bacterium]
MRESFVNYLWSKQMFITPQLKSVQNDGIQVVTPGVFTEQDGPDFFNAQIYLNGQLWAGNVEVHIKASDWYAHRHEQDIRYDNVILHVVWEYDVPVFRRDGTEIPTLAVSKYTCTSIQIKYSELFTPKKRLNCEKQIQLIPELVWIQWKERLYVERLEEKIVPIQELSSTTQNYWEYIFFCALARSFGLNANADNFMHMAKKLSMTILLKHGHSLFQIEALFYGLVGLLEPIHSFNDAYLIKLQKEWKYLKEKWNLVSNSSSLLQFFKLRPSNFPTIRLAQLAAWFHKNRDHMGTLLITKDIQVIRKSFDIEVSEYWIDHYTMDHVSKPTTKKLSNSFIDLVIINTIVPFQLAYTKYKGDDTEPIDALVEMMYQLKPEQNSIITFFESLGVSITSAFDTQALLQLKTRYCNHNKCMQCAIGKYIINY